MTWRVDRVLASNPGPYTGPGTNTYVVGDETGVIVLDPGPVDGAHADAIVATAGDRPVSAVVVTHTHPDHAPLANPLGRRLEVPVLGHRSGPAFEPDGMLADGDRVTAGGRILEVIHTPGHADDHLCFRSGDVLFTGDHIMGGSSVMVEDVGAYLASLRRVRDERLSRLYPGHGPEIDRPVEVIDWYVAHRLERERQIAGAVAAGASTIGEVVERVYVDVDSALHPIAARSVAAHLRKLAGDGALRVEGEGWDAPVEALR